jgi:hypothetical protein
MTNRQNATIRSLLGFYVNGINGRIVFDGEDMVLNGESPFIPYGSLSSSVKHPTNTCIISSSMRIKSHI